MQRLALHAAVVVGVLGFWGCGTDSAGSPPSAASGAASGGAAGTTAASAAGAPNSVAGSTPGVSGAAASGQAGGAGAGSAGSGGMPPGGGGAGTSGDSGAGGGPPKQPGKPYVYLGGSGNFPLRVYALDVASGALTQKGSDENGGPSPTFLALDPSGTHLYNANEDNGQSAGVTAHHIKADGTLEPLNHQQGSDNCNGSCGFTHVAVDPTGKFVLAAAYDGGSVSVFPIAADGSLGAEKQMLDFGGQSEAHSTGFDASGKYAFVPTLGLDRVQQLKLGSDGSLSANDPASVKGPTGSGPRHVALHPNGKVLFVINEQNSTLTPYALSASGTLTAGSAVSTLPAGFSGESYGQHVKVSPNGRFIYGSNVGHDSIAVFEFDVATSAVKLIQNQDSGGAWPRDFDVDPNGEVLVAANRDSATLNVFKIGSDGKLTPLGQPLKTSAEPTAVVIRIQK